MTLTHWRNIQIPAVDACNALHIFRQTYDWDMSKCDGQNEFIVRMIRLGTKNMKVSKACYRALCEHTGVSYKCP